MYSKNDYLEIMGIQRWRMRSLSPNVALDPLDLKEPSRRRQDERQNSVSYVGMTNSVENSPKTSKTMGIGFSSWILINTETSAPTAVLRLEANSLDFKEEEVDKLLDAMLAAVQLKRTVWVENNEVPENLLQIIMGEMLAQKVLRVSLSLDILRAKNTERLKNTTPILVTYHPEMLLAEPKFKRNAWEDLKRLIV